MKRELNPTFTSALAGAGRKTTPEELSKKGVKKLRTYRLSEISFLIERALNKTLAARTLSPVDAEEMAELSGRAEKEFKRQLESLDELRASRGDLERHRDSVKRELADLRAKVQERRSGLSGKDSVRHLAIELRGALRPLVDKARAPEWMTKDVVTELLAIVESRASAGVEEQRKAFEDEIQTLERRIAKLVKSLSNMEQALEKLAKTKDLETGIASIYRTVQGLGGDESDLDQKRVMMAAVFAANVELQKKIDFA